MRSADRDRKMLNSKEGELVKLLSTMTNVNSELAQTSQVLTRDFSDRRSAKKSTQDS